MKRWSIINITLVATGLFCGCSISGSWETISVLPKGAPFPIDKVIFDSQNNYTSTWTYEGETHTSTGQFRFEGNKLTLTNPYHKPRIFKAHLRSDGLLELIVTDQPEIISATLRKEK